MFAVFKTGGKQYKVAPGDVLKIERMNGAEGDMIQFDEILMISDAGKLSVGSPLVEKAKISAELLEQGRHKKVIIFKKKRRQNYRRKKGHKQHMSVIRIIGIEGAGIKVGFKPAVKKAPAKAEKALVKKAAPKKTIAKK